MKFIYLIYYYKYLYVSINYVPCFKKVHIFLRKQRTKNIVTLKFKINERGTFIFFPNFLDPPPLTPGLLIFRRFGTLFCLHCKIFLYCVYLDTPSCDFHFHYHFLVLVCFKCFKCFKIKNIPEENNFNFFCWNDTAIKNILTFLPI